MDVQTRKSILMDAFEELKKKWSNLNFGESEIDGLPESRISELMEIREKYQLNDIEFLFIVGTAIGFYQGQKVAIEDFSKKMASVNEFVYSMLGRKI